MEEREERGATLFWIYWDNVIPDPKVEIAKIVPPLASYTIYKN